jgi:cystathionine beta-synthase
MSAYGNVLDMIGNTPMVEFRNLDAGPCRLFAKLEAYNPGGSIKDRIALSMIEGAEREGRIDPGGTLVEATSGNTGVGLALVAARKGYRVIIVIPDKMSREKIAHLRAFGAQVLVTRSDVEPGHPEHYQTKAARIAAEMDNAFYVNQHNNPHNPRAHEEGTAPEIWEQMGHDLDAVVCGVGTGGTLTGMGRFLQRVAPEVEIVLADPEGSILVEYIESGRLAEAGAWLIEGIGEDVLPPIGDLSLLSQGFTISDAESLHTAREVFRKEGIMGGSSTGTLVAAALKYCRQQDRPKRVVTFVPDSGDKYLSKMYNDYWMVDQGFVERETFGDLRDLIARRHEERSDFTVTASDSLLTAYGRMKLYDVSQLPVVEGDRVMGLIDESDILLAVYGAEENFSQPVAEAMSTRLETVSSSTALRDLLPVFENDHVPLIVDGDQYHGLVTRIDFLNFLRRKMR